MPDLVLDAQIDLTVNESDLKSEIASAERMFEQRRGQAPGRVGGGAGVGGVAVGTIIGQLVTSLTRAVGKLIKTILELPRLLIGFARGLRGASPIMNRVFTLFERRMMLFRRELGGMLAGPVESILDSIATTAERAMPVINRLVDILDRFVQRLPGFLDAGIEILSNLTQSASETVKNINSARQGLRNLLAPGVALEQSLEFGGDQAEILRNMRQNIRAGEQIPSGGPLDILLSLLEDIKEDLDKTKQNTAQTEEELRQARFERMRDAGSRFNDEVMSPIMRKLGTAPARGVNQPRRGLTP